MPKIVRFFYLHSEDLPMKIYASLFCITSLFLSLELLAQHKIVYLISPPRSLSTAFMRMIQARGDFSILNEPTLAAYCNIFSKEFGEKTYKKDAPQTFKETKEKILKKAKISPVFVKEMSVSSREFFLDQPQFLKNPNIHFVFLIRNPHGMMISSYKKHNDFTTPNFLDWFSFKELMKVFLMVKQKSPHKPIIISAEELCAHPEKTVLQLCNQLEIPYLDHALHWENLGDDFTGKELWNEIKPKELTYYWHEDAIKSTGFGTLTHYEVDENGEPTFSEITNTEHREVLQKLYYENLVYYEQMEQSK